MLTFIKPVVVVGIEIACRVRRVIDATVPWIRVGERPVHGSLLMQIIPARWIQ
jgi:hypothetical protein